MKNYKQPIFNDAMRVAANYSSSLIELINDPIFIINKLNLIVNVNQATVNKTELARNKLIGTDITQYFTDPKKIKKACLEIFKNGFITDLPFVLMDGQLSYVLISGSVYEDDNNENNNAVIVASEITKNK
jgi:PAS domain-containing protein